MASPMQKLRDHLPTSLHPLVELATNYWWTWHNEFEPVFDQINAQVWQESRNPIRTILETKSTELERLGCDNNYLKDLNDMYSAFSSYMECKQNWFQNNHGTVLNGPVAYFCAEFALHESLPIYSGGLGVLAGDHIKSASDLGLPSVFIGLLYREGYFIQAVNESGHQVDRYVEIVLEHQPLQPVITDTGKRLRLSVPWGNDQIHFEAFQVSVGRTKLFLLDIDIEDNAPDIRKFGDRLYGGDKTMRLAQEIVLGIGGQRLLHALEITPSVYHMNEGHSGFFQLARLADAIQSGENWKHALEDIKRSTVFTTHTPVPAGNEVFAISLIHEYLAPFVAEAGIPWHKFANLGWVSEGSNSNYFSMTVFALNSSYFANGVSELHGRVARRMWNSLWPNLPTNEVPIQSITNGVHVPTWTTPDIKSLFTKHLGPEWVDQQADPTLWQTIKAIPDREIAHLRKDAKSRLIRLIRERLKIDRNTDLSITESDLIIGFARRFATYKRATLLLTDKERLKLLVNDPQRPVRFVFAGKAHPADKPGQEFIGQIFRLSLESEFRGKIIFLENYDMNIARHMVAACDVWLNTPRRPFEASGTSGQKVPLNGGINFSVLDGWWREGFNGHNGWPIGKELDFASEHQQDEEDSASFYEVLETTIIPLFFSNRGTELYSPAWLRYVKDSMASLIPKFNTHRMVQDYVNDLYLPAYRAHSNQLEQEENLTDRWRLVHFSQLNWPTDCRELTSHYREFMASPLHNVESPVDHTLPGRVRRFQGPLSGRVYVGHLPPENIAVELIVTDDQNLNLMQVQRIPLQERDEAGEMIFNFTPKLERPDSARMRLRIRWIPDPDLPQTCFGLMIWQ